jgi:DNA-binding XRE family transcriptional regulator
MFVHPFCHLLIKVIRCDSPPFQNRLLQAKELANYRVTSGLTLEKAAAAIGVSLKTFQNWESGRTKPSAIFWPRIRSLLEAKC